MEMPTFEPVPDSECGSNTTPNMNPVLVAPILAGDPRALARAATLIENRHPSAASLLRDLFPHTGRALVLGITGSPGAGKSTLTSALIRHLRASGQRVAVLAVDPTSPFSGGAILGDRIRMLDHAEDPGVYIRSMATRGHLGGLAAATGDLALLLDAAGFNTVIIETVGVGQDEVDIASVAQVTCVVLAPGQGDDVQALKAGVLEIADIFVLNKFDQPGAEKLEQEMRAALDLAETNSEWRPPLLRAVASRAEGIEPLLEAVQTFIGAGHAARRAPRLWAARLRQMYAARLLDLLDPAELAQAAADVAGRKADPYTIMEVWLARARPSP